MTHRNQAACHATATGPVRMFAASLLLCGLSAASAFAADLAARIPVKEPRAPVSFSWTGFYAGLNAGIGSAQTRGSNPLGLAPNQLEDNGRGFAGGGQAGFNWQVAPNWVIGIEGDVGYLGIDHAPRS